MAQWAYVVGGFVLILLEAALIGALLIDRALRRRAKRIVQERLAFERFISDLSARLLNSAAEAVDEEVERALANIVGAMRLDRCSLFAYEAENAEIRITHSVGAWEVALREDVAPAQLPWLQGQLIHGITVILDDVVAQLPAFAAAERSYAKRYGLKAVAIVPITSRDGVLRGVSYQSGRCRDWETEIVSRLQAVAEILVTALVDKRAVSALRVREERLRVALEARDPARKDDDKEPAPRARLQVVKSPVTTDADRVRHPSG